MTLSTKEELGVDPEATVAAPSSEDWASRSGAAEVSGRDMDQDSSDRQIQRLSESDADQLPKNLVQQLDAGQEIRGMTYSNSPGDNDAKDHMRADSISTLR